MPAPVRVELLHKETNEWTPFLVYADGTVYEQRYRGDRRVTDPALKRKVIQQVKIDARGGRLK